MNWELQPDGGWAAEDAEYLAHVTPLLSAGQITEGRRQEYCCRVWREGPFEASGIRMSGGSTLVFDVRAEHSEMGRYACEVYVHARRLTDLVTMLDATLTALQDAEAEMSLGCARLVRAARVGIRKAVKR